MTVATCWHTFAHRVAACNASICSRPGLGLNAVAVAPPPRFGMYRSASSVAVRAASASRRCRCCTSSHPFSKTNVFGMFWDVQAGQFCGRSCSKCFKAMQVSYVQSFIFKNKCIWDVSASRQCRYRTTSHYISKSKSILPVFDPTHDIF